MLRCTALIRRLQLITWSQPMPSLQKRSAHLAVPSQVTQSNRVHEVMISRRLTASERRHRVQMRKCCQLSPVTLLQPPTGVENKELLPEPHITCEEREETHLLLTTGVSNQLKRMAYRGSVKPFVHFNAKHDAEILHRAMKGIGTDEDAILMLLSGRNNDQRQQIKAAYKKAYGKDLVSALKSELGGLFESLIVALMTPPSSYDASQLHKALKGAGTDDDVLIEILASRTGEQIKDIVKVYKKEFNGKLEKDICGDTSGHYQKLLVILLQGSREEGVDEEKIEKDAKELYAAGEGKFGTDEEKFITILGNRSAEHLRKVFDAYNTLSGSDIEDSIEGETTGNLENLLLAVVKCARSVPAFFAEVLYKSMRRAGTDDGTLMRIMVSRSEVDMLDIRACFKTKYKASLYTTIQEDTDGDYQKALLYLCGGND